MVRTRTDRAVDRAPSNRKVARQLEFQDASSAFYSQLKPERLKLLTLSEFLKEYGIVRWNKQAQWKLKHDLCKLRHQRAYERSFRNRGKFVYRPLHQGEYDIFTEARAFFDELVGILVNAAVERVNVASPKRLILRGLKRGQRKPREVTTSPEKFVPEVLTLIAGHYRRGDGPSGADGFDVLGYTHRRPPKRPQTTTTEGARVRGKPFVLKEPIAHKVGEAAMAGKKSFQASTMYSRKLATRTEQTKSLAEDLRQWLMRFGSKPKRPYDNLQCSSADSLLDIVLEPLNALIKKHGGHPYKREWLLKLICKKAD